MKIYTSYFYQLRFFKPYQIPISTAAWDPKWYYNKKQGVSYVDKNGVINGLRADVLVLPSNLYDNECSPCHYSPPNCPFMIKYRQYLDSLDFNDIYNRCESIANRVQSLLKFTQEPEIILMVHEPVSRLCAERPVLQQWFKDNGCPIQEWQHD